MTDEEAEMLGHDAAESMWEMERDRIEALTAEKNKLGNLLLETADRNAREIVRLEVENERLREALKDLLEDTQHKDHDCGDEKWCPVIKARAALEGKQ